MSKVWNSAIIGYGVVGSWHGQVLNSLPSAKLRAVCDVNRDEVRRRVHEQVGEVETYGSLDDMLEAHPEVEVCHIATASGNHLEPAMKCMEAGKNVICEKPLEITLERCDRLIAAAKENGVKIGGIFQNRWREENRAIRRAVDDGRFGTIAYAACFTPWWRTDEYYRSGDWRGTWSLDGGGAIMNQSVHYIDMLQWMAGPIRRVSATASNRIHTEIEVEDTLCASVEFESGARGLIMGSTAMFPGFAQRIEIGGDGGTVMTGDIRAARFRRSSGDADEDMYSGEFVDATEEFFPTVDTTSGGGSSPTDVPTYLHERNIAHIHDAWESGREAETSGDEARKAIAIIEALYTSVREGGRPVEVDHS